MLQSELQQPPDYYISWNIFLQCFPGFCFSLWVQIGIFLYFINKFIFLWTLLEEVIILSKGAEWYWNFLLLNIICYILFSPTSISPHVYFIIFTSIKFFTLAYIYFFIIYLYYIFRLIQILRGILKYQTIICRQMCAYLCIYSFFPIIIFFPVWSQHFSSWWLGNGSWVTMFCERKWAAEMNCGYAPKLVQRLDGVYNSHVKGQQMWCISKERKTDS